MTTAIRKRSKGNTPQAKKAPEMNDFAQQNPQNDQDKADDDRPEKILESVRERLNEKDVVKHFQVILKARKADDFYSPGMGKRKDDVMEEGFPDKKGKQGKPGKHQEPAPEVFPEIVFYSVGSARAVDDPNRIIHGQPHLLIFERKFFWN